MALNTLAGRSFNDLNQYPVFPWILTDYTSPTIDLSDPKIYRDLSKPIGALNPTRLQQFLERYEAFDDPVIPKFLYGSHYSSPGGVLYFLMRLEPYTTYFRQLGGGKFDNPERQFISFAKAFDGVLTNNNNLKELVSPANHASGGIVNFVVCCCFFFFCADTGVFLFAGSVDEHEWRGFWRDSSRRSSWRSDVAAMGENS
jgi:hypothetical protein